MKIVRKNIGRKISHLERDNGVIRILRLKEKDRCIIDRIIKNKIISYDNIWTILRILPKKAYMEFLKSPINIRG